jgi:hypothetical protein
VVTSARRTDAYQTPVWVTEALLPHLPRRISSIWEPAAGAGKLVGVLESAGFQVVATDIEDGEDFFTSGDDWFATEQPTDAIITNPPSNISVRPSLSNEPCRSPAWSPCS